MNAVEIEEAVSKLMEAAYDAAEFPYAFLEAFGNKDATIRRLRSTGKNTTNKSDIEGDGVVAVLQRNNIHIAAITNSGSPRPASGRGAGGEGRPLRPFAGQFPYVNGGLFGHARPPLADARPSQREGDDTQHPPSGRVAEKRGGEGNTLDVPKFTQIARSYLLHIGSLDWTRINPDIFGSMIQAVADDEERGALGMHYTSVPNILKVLNPLFLDDLHNQLKEAGTNARKLLNLRKRLARIRVFDPACGSGNFLVIAYKQMRAIEAEINVLRGEPDRASDIPLTNFRGIELRHFAVEVARLALIIAEYQCDELYRGQRLALAEFLPLNKENWITHGNALRLDWLKVCPPTGTGGIKLTEDDLFQTPLDQPEIDFENEGGETYICGNPPYVGDKKQSKLQKSDIKEIFENVTTAWKSLDYICGFFYKAVEFVKKNEAVCAFVSTNSLVQGQHVPRFWSLIIDKVDICFAVSSFTWSNLAANKAGVTCVIIGICQSGLRASKVLADGEITREVDNITPYLTAGPTVIVMPSTKSIFGLPRLTLGNVPKDDGGLLLSRQELEDLALNNHERKRWTKFALGSTEFIQGKTRFCLWLSDDEAIDAIKNQQIQKRIQHVKHFRDKSVDPGMVNMARRPHQFREMNVPNGYAIAVPRVSSENRQFLPTGVIDESTIITDRNYALYAPEFWCLALVSSRLHRAWIATVCVRMRTDFSYSNTLGWNTFPVPPLTDQNKADLTRCAEDILLAREAHWPATIAELYDPDKMPGDLRAAHDRNDETLERIYIGRRFKNDTERLETLFAMYTEMTSKEK